MIGQTLQVETTDGKIFNPQKDSNNSVTDMRGEANVESYMVNPVIDSKKYRVYLNLMIISHVICLIFKFISVAYLIVYRLSFRRNSTMIMESVTVGSSALFIIIVFCMTVRHRVKLTKETRNIKNPFVPYCLRYIRAFLLLLAFLFYFCSFSYAIILFTSLKIRIFIILHSLQFLFQIFLISTVIYEVAFVFDIPHQSQKMRDCKKLHKQLKLIPYVN